MNLTTVTFTEWSLNWIEKFGNEVKKKKKDKISYNKVREKLLLSYLIHQINIFAIANPVGLKDLDPPLIFSYTH